VEAVIVLRNLSLERSSISCQVGRRFAAECFCLKQETLSMLWTWFIQWTVPFSSTLNVQLL